MMLQGKRLGQIGIMTITDANGEVLRIIVTFIRDITSYLDMRKTIRIDTDNHTHSHDIR